MLIGNAFQGHPGKYVSAALRTRRKMGTMPYRKRSRSAISIPSGEVASFFKGLGEGKFSTTPVNSPISVSNETGLAGPAFGADLNGDGKLDLVIASGPVCCGQSGPVTILLGNGDGTFTTGESITVNTATGTGQAAAIALAVFNGDHIPGYRRLGWS